MVDTSASKAFGETRAGSNPALGTKKTAPPWNSTGGLFMQVFLYAAST